MKIALLALLLGGCALGNELVKPAVDVSETTIKWVRGIEPNCGGVRSPLGCAVYRLGSCTFTTPEDTADWVLAHEVRHCFGYVHK